MDKRTVFCVLFAALLLMAVAGPMFAEVPAEGTPEEAFQQFAIAVSNGDFGEMLRFTSMDWSMEIQKKKPDEQQALFRALQNSTPQVMKITGKETAGDRIILYAEGMVADMTLKKMKKRYAQAVMVKEYGRWRVARVFWQQKPFPAGSVPN